MGAVAPIVDGTTVSAVCVALGALVTSASGLVMQVRREQHREVEDLEQQLRMLLHEVHDVGPASVVSVGPIGPPFDARGHARHVRRRRWRLYARAMLRQAGDDIIGFTR